MSKIITSILDQRWTMKPEALKAMLSIVSEHSESEKDWFPNFSSEASRMQEFHSTGLTNEEAIQKLNGEPLNSNYQSVRVRGSVALIPVMGAIFPRANIMTDYSGAVSLELLSKQFSAVLADNRIDTIIFIHDSPGGVITGVSEFGDLIASSQKKTISYVEGYSASASYWLSSQTDEIVLADTAEVGSIGVVVGYTDTSAKDEKAGIKNIEIVSSQSPNKRLNPSSDAGRQEIQTILDQLADVFIGKVASGRKVEKSVVENTFGGGGMFVASQAVALNMADSVMTLENLIDRENKQTQTNGGIFMGEENKAPIMTVEAIRESSPEAYEKIFASGKEEGIVEGVSKENARIKAIEELSKDDASVAVITEHKFEIEQTKDTIATLILSKQEEDKSEELAKLKKDAPESVGSGSTDEESEAMERKSVIDAIASVSV